MESVPMVTWEDRVKSFHMKHEGETGVVITLGPNLHLTPPTLFDYPSFGINTYYRHVEDYGCPTYFVGVDARLFREGGEEIKELYKDIPKFIPTPDRDDIDGENFYRFFHRSGDIYIGGQMPNHHLALTRQGIAYHRILGAVFQIAWYMGFSRLLVIGLGHKPGEENEHSWGNDPKGFQGQNPRIWYREYQHWANCGLGEILNISEDTYVPDDVLKKDSYKNWINVKEKENGN